MAKRAGGHSVYRNDARGEFKIFPGDGVVPGWSQVAWTAGSRRDAEPLLRAYQNPCHDCGLPAQFPSDHAADCHERVYAGTVIA